MQLQKRAEKTGITVDALSYLISGIRENIANNTERSRPDERTPIQPRIII